MNEVDSRLRKQDAPLLRSLFWGFPSIAVFRHSREEHVSGGVQRCFTGILDNTDNKSNAHYLHGYVVGNSE